MAPVAVVVLVVALHSVCVGLLPRASVGKLALVLLRLVVDLLRSRWHVTTETSVRESGSIGTGYRAERASTHSSGWAAGAQQAMGHRAGAPGRRRRPCSCRTCSGRGSRCRPRPIQAVPG